MYEFGDTIIDLGAVSAIQWAGGTCAVIVTIGSTTLFLTPECKEGDDDDTYEQICDKRHGELVSAWQKAKFLNKE